MRNLKRALSLALASVMLLGMMVVGSSAAGFPDVDDNDNVEAIEVLQAIDLMIGDADTGNFSPDRPVKRAEMAVIVAKLQNLTTSYYVSTCPFPDVSGTFDWARGPVGAAYASGIISGRSATVFDPDATVTAVEAASMLMRVLGYFQNPEDVADGFNLATVRQANQIGLFSGIEGDATTPMTRNQVAKLTWNALQANMVDFKGQLGVEINGVKVGYNGLYEFRSGTDAKYSAISALGNTTDGTTNRSYIQLGEERYEGKLRLNDNATDDFGRPSRHWEYDGKSVGTYAKTELIRKEYTTEVSGRELYDLLGSELLNDKVWSLDVAIDGISDSAIDPAMFNSTALNRNNRAGVGATGRGVLTQVFVDNNKHEVTIAIINTYLARATADYDTRKETASLRVYGIDEVATARGNFVKKISAGNDEEIFKVSNEDFDVADVKDGDAFLVTVADGAIQSMKDVEPMAGVEVSSFQSRDLTKNGSGNLTTGGTKYDFSDTAEYENACLVAYTGTSGSNINLKDLTYNVYLDAYGYVIGVVEVDKPTNYLFITGVNGGENNLTSITAEANAIFLDGTMETIKIDLKESTDLVALLEDDNRDSRINKWFTYSKNNSDIYALELVAVDAGADADGQSHVTWNDSATVNRTVNKKNIYMSTISEELNASPSTKPLVYGNDKSVYISVTAKRIDTTKNTKDVVIDNVDSVITGINDVDIKVQTQDEVEAATGAPSGDDSGTAHGAYTLYDDGGWIVAMVIVGEDNGSNSTFAYVHNDSVAQEYLMSDKTFKWERTVVIDGVEATLTEVNDVRISLLQRMDENKWYRVRTNANGEVTAILGAPSAASTLDSDTDADAGGKFGNWGLTATSVPNAYNTDFDGATSLVGSYTTAGVETVLYHEAFTNQVPHADGHTLYVNQQKNSGLRFATDVKVVLDQINDNKRETYFGEGQSDLKEFLGDLHPSNDAAPYTYNYEVSAILKGGVAQVVIFKDLVADGDGGVTPPTPAGGKYSSVVDADALDSTLKLVAFGESGYDMDMITGEVKKFTQVAGESLSTQVKDYLAYKGFTNLGNLKRNSSNNGYEIAATNDDGIEMVIAIADSVLAATNQAVLVTVDGVKGYVSDATTTISAAGKDLGVTTTGTFAKKSDNNFADVSAAIAPNEVYESGYYSVTKPTVTAINGITVTTTINGGAGPVYLKKNDTFTVTYTFGGDYTQTAGGSKTVTPANATTPNVTSTAIAGLSNVTYEVASNVLTITKANAATTATGTPALTLTYTVGTDDVSFS